MQHGTMVIAIQSPTLLPCWRMHVLHICMTVASLDDQRSCQGNQYPRQHDQKGLVMGQMSDKEDVHIGQGSLCFARLERGEQGWKHSSASKHNKTSVKRRFGRAVLGLLL